MGQVEIETLIRLQHSERAINRGRAQWRIAGQTEGNAEVVVVYDHPHGRDARAARVVSAWPR